MWEQCDSCLIPASLKIQPSPPVHHSKSQSLTTTHRGHVDDNSVSESVRGTAGKEVPGFALELRE